MQPKLTTLRRKIRTPRGDYDVVPWSGANDTGYEPEGDYVLILPDQAQPRTDGGILITDESLERINEASETGVLVAIGPEAWKWNTDRTRRREAPAPTIGSRVMFARYAGAYVHGSDGKNYRLMEDKCIAAVEVGFASEPLRKPAEETTNGH